MIKYLVNCCQELGVHLNDIVEVNIGKNENGEINCFCYC